MKKIYYIFFALLMFVPLYTYDAASITETSFVDNRIIISGSGEGEIQIVLFGLDNLPLYLTTATAENGIFSITLPEIETLVDGNYTIKASDYDGTNVATDVVEVNIETNPQTSDNITFYIIIGVVSIIGIIVSGIYLTKTLKTKNKK